MPQIGQLPGLVGEDLGVHGAGPLRRAEADEDEDEDEDEDGDEDEATDGGDGSRSTATRCGHPAARRPDSTPAGSALNRVKQPVLQK